VALNSLFWPSDDRKEGPTDQGPQLTRMVADPMDTLVETLKVCRYTLRISCVGMVKELTRVRTYKAIQQ
jgi:hypothetical protein